MLNDLTVYTQATLHVLNQTTNKMENRGIVTVAFGPSQREVREAAAAAAKTK